jgi:hypothetical protein
MPQIISGSGSQKAFSTVFMKTFEKDSIYNIGTPESLIPKSDKINLYGIYLTEFTGSTQNHRITKSTFSLIH